MKARLPFIVIGFLAASAPAEEFARTERTTERADVRSATTTAQWLDLQRSGAARGAPNALPAEALERIYDRYLGSVGAAPAAAATPPR